MKPFPPGHRMLGVPGMVIRHDRDTKPKHQRRDIVNAIFYRERTECQWRNLPHAFPPWKQVFEYYRTWLRRSGGEASQVKAAGAESEACKAQQRAPQGT